jgi:hypothetical protein
MFGMHRLDRDGKGIAKVGLLGAIAWYWAQERLGELLGLGRGASLGGARHAWDALITRCCSRWRRAGGDRPDRLAGAVAAPQHAPEDEPFRKCATSTRKPKARPNARPRSRQRQRQYRHAAQWPRRCARRSSSSPTRRISRSPGL